MGKSSCVGKSLGCGGESHTDTLQLDWWQVTDGNLWKIWQLLRKYSYTTKVLLWKECSIQSVCGDPWTWIYVHVCPHFLQRLSSTIVYGPLISVLLPLLLPSLLPAPCQLKYQHIFSLNKVLTKPYQIYCSLKRSSLHSIRNGLCGIVVRDQRSLSPSTVNC